MDCETVVLCVGEKDGLLKPHEEIPTLFLLLGKEKHYRENGSPLLSSTIIKALRSETNRVSMQLKIIIFASIIYMCVSFKSFYQS